MSLAQYLVFADFVGLHPGFLSLDLVKAIYSACTDSSKGLSFTAFLESLVSCALTAEEKAWTVEYCTEKKVRFHYTYKDAEKSRVPKEYTEQVADLLDAMEARQPTTMLQKVQAVKRRHEQDDLSGAGTTKSAARTGRGSVQTPAGATGDSWDRPLRHRPASGARERPPRLAPPRPPGAGQGGRRSSLPSEAAAQGGLARAPRPPSSSAPRQTSPRRVQALNLQGAHAPPKPRSPRSAAPWQSRPSADRALLLSREMSTAASVRGEPSPRKPLPRRPQSASPRRPTSRVLSPRLPSEVDANRRRHSLPAAPPAHERNGNAPTPSRERGTPRPSANRPRLVTLTELALTKGPVRRAVAHAAPTDASLCSCGLPSTSLPRTIAGSA